MNLYQDVTETVVVDVTMAVDAIMDADVIPALFSEEITVVYGLSYFSCSAADAAATLLAVMDAAAMTAVSGSFSFSSSAADVAVTHGITMAVDAAAAYVTIADANQRIYYIIKAPAHRGYSMGRCPFLIFLFINIPYH